ncbi:21679_t:CDS:2, partial [Racocetra persica]
TLAANFKTSSVLDMIENNYKTFCSANEMMIEANFDIKAKVINILKSVGFDDFLKPFTMSSAANILTKQFKELTSNPVPGFTVALPDDGNVFEWDVGIIGAPGTIYEGGYFKANLKFPNDYPYNPPTFKFNNEFFHPNVYQDDRLCISILHPPGDDPTSGETAA